MTKRPRSSHHPLNEYHTIDIDLPNANVHTRVYVDKTTATEDSVGKARQASLMFEQVRRSINPEAVMDYKSILRSTVNVFEAAALDLGPRLSDRYIELGGSSVALIQKTPEQYREHLSVVLKEIFDTDETWEDFSEWFLVHVVMRALGKMRTEFTPETVSQMSEAEYETTLSRFMYEDNEDIDEHTKFLVATYAESLAEVVLSSTHTTDEIAAVMGIGKPDAPLSSEATMQVPEIPHTDQTNDLTMAFPNNPVMHAALTALYSAESKTNWTLDHYQRPQYSYEPSQDNRITFFFERQPDGLDAVSAVWRAVQKLSVETADVFLILMSKIAELNDPRRDTAKIRLDEIAALRGIKTRHGSVSKLYDDFKQEVLRLANLRLTMVWKDYKHGGTVSFGREIPDRLLDIVDVEFRHDDGETWTAFGFRCGQAFAHFLNEDDYRWIGNFSKALLNLNPKHDALTKKIGSYYTFRGIIEAKKGRKLRVTPRIVLSFSGEEPNWKKPTRTVEKFWDSNQRLVELGLLDEGQATLDALRPPKERAKGYFEKWLDKGYSVKLSENIWRLNQAPEIAKQTSPRRKRVAAKNAVQATLPLPLDIPTSVSMIQENPEEIRRFRTDYGIRQEQLASDLGITRESLSRYERGVRRPPNEIAQQILLMWREKSSM